MITERTRQEMEAGARALSKGNALPEGYMDAIMRTADRMAQLEQWAKDGRVVIDKTVRYYGSMRQRQTIIHVGTKLTFHDEFAEANGSFPSELMIAKIALALEANQDKV